MSMALPLSLCDPLTFALPFTCAVTTGEVLLILARGTSADIAVTVPVVKTLSFK